METANTYLKENNYKQVPQLSSNFKINRTTPFLISTKRQNVIKQINQYIYYINLLGYYYSRTGNSYYKYYLDLFKNIVEKYKI